jgi:hypothetical protein
MNSPWKFLRKYLKFIFLELLIMILCKLLQCGKPFFSNTRQNGKWTETSTRQNEIELAMFGE